MFSISTSQLLTALTAAALAPLASSLPVATPRATCVEYMMLNVRGTNEPPNSFFATKDIIGRVKSTRPYGAVYEVQYPADMDITQAGTLEGVADITRVIEDGLKNCPDQRYALLGYSQGATVVDRTLQKYAPDSPIGQAIDAVLLMGNPYHSPGQKGNIDQNGGDTTAMASGVLNLAGGFMTPDYWYDTGKVLDICYQDDPICNGVNLPQLNVLGLNLGNLVGDILPNLLKSGQLQLSQLVNSNHLVYNSVQSVQNLATDFLKAFLPLRK